MCALASFCALFMTINLGMVIVCMNKGHTNSSNSTEMEGSNCTANPEFEIQSTCGVNTTQVREIISNKHKVNNCYASCIDRNKM